MSLRILHLVGASEDNGGILSVLRNLQTASASRAWAHATWVRPEYREARKPSLTYLRTQFLWNEHENHLKLLASGVRAGLELRSLLSREHFDVIHAHSRGSLITAVLATSLLKRRVVFTNHAYARRTGMYRWAAGVRGLHTTVLTPNMARHYRLAAPSQQVSVISECCADAWFQRPVATPLRSDGGRPQVFVGLGNLLPWKKWDLILEALLRMSTEESRRFRVEIYGPTPNIPEAADYERTLRAKAAAAGLEAIFVLKGPTQDVAGVLASADWFVLPSTNEPCSVALIEALAAGVPSLVSASGGNVDIIRPGASGLLFEPDNPADLKARMLEAWSRRSALAGAEDIRGSVAHRCASQVVAQFEPLYRWCVWGGALPG